MLKRTISGAVFVVLVLGLTWLGQWTFVALMSLIIVLSLREFFAISNGIHDLGKDRFTVIGIGVLLFITYALSAFGFVQSRLDHVLGIGLYVYLILLMLQGRIKRPIESMGLSFFGLLYVVLPIVLSLRLVYSEGSYSPTLFIGVLLITWTNDTFAYLSGKLLGRRKLWPSVSPGKTWEGTIGGMLFATGVCLLLMYWQEMNWHLGLVIGPGISIAAVLGDLFESRLKRQLNIKDSGAILPGHGGALDRFDAMFMVLPLSVLLLELFGSF